MRSAVMSTTICFIDARQAVDLFNLSYISDKNNESKITGTHAPAVMLRRNITAAAAEKRSRAIRRMNGIDKHSCNPGPIRAAVEIS